jgi:hypothetical protein
MTTRDDGPFAPATLNIAMAHAVDFVGGISGGFVHPSRPAFVVLGRRLFATVETTETDRADENTQFLIRLARYSPAGSHGAQKMSKRLLGDGYKEMGRV